MSQCCETVFLSIRHQSYFKDYFLLSFLNQNKQTSKAFKMEFYWLLHASAHKPFKEESGGALDPPRPPLAPPLLSTDG